MSFVTREAVRCDDCETRADLTNDGHLADEAMGRVRACSGCGGRPVVVHEMRRQRDRSLKEEPVNLWGHVPPPSALDPYASPVDPTDPYAAKRASLAARHRITHAPRPLRRRFFETARIEALMTEES